MTNGSRSRLRAMIVVPFAAIVALVGVVVPATLDATPAAAQAGTVTIDGYGWGHGNGLSQYGAYGYAVDHGWDWRQILNHYYSNTTEGSLSGGHQISVQLDTMGAADTIVVRQDGGLRTSATGATSATAWLIRPEGNQYRMFSGAGCAGPWSDHGLHSTTDVRVSYPSDQGDTVHHSQLLQVCEPFGGRTWYRGDIHARRGTQNEHRTVNVTTMERYLRGVVPRESPASWSGSDGNGPGMNALKAQAVAARSYAAAEARTSYAQTCDTTSCQVYAGAFHSDPGGGPASREDFRTDRAIWETAGIVRMLGGSPARTEFSSSSGGWTSGRTFPAVQDLGDSTASNRNHTWRSQLKISAIEAKYPQIGHFTGIEVTQRNGIGPDGGRVLEVVIRGSAGQVSLTGHGFRAAFGAMSNCTSTTGTQVCIKSDWFAPRFAPAAAVAVADTGYWVARSDGTVVAFEGASWYGDMGGHALAAPVLGMATPPDGSGYWLVARDGGIFTFGNAAFYGSTGALRLNQPVVGMSSTKSGNGYWLVARDGGIFTFGDAAFYGSTGALRLNQPIVGMARTPSGLGYWLVAADGGIFTFGDATFHGSLGGSGVQAVGISPSTNGNGYWIVSSSGTTYPFGDA